MMVVVSLLLLSGLLVVVKVGDGIGSALFAAGGGRLVVNVTSLTDNHFEEKVSLTLTLEAVLGSKLMETLRASWRTESGMYR